MTCPTEAVLPVENVALPVDPPRENYVVITTKIKDSNGDLINGVVVDSEVILPNPPGGSVTQSQTINGYGQIDALVGVGVVPVEIRIKYTKPDYEPVEVTVTLVRNSKYGYSNDRPPNDIEVTMEDDD